MPRRKKGNENKMTTVAVVGLGYVGLPLAVEFGKRHPTIGFDLSAEKVESYRRHVDPTGEVSTADLAAMMLARADPAALAAADFIIVAVLMPRTMRPARFRPLGASQAVGVATKRGATVVTNRPSIPRDGGDLHSSAGGAFEDALAAGLQRRLFAGAHQPGRQGTHADQDHESRFGRYAGDARARRADVWERGHGGRAPRGFDQGGRGRQGHREHAARPQHRADERAAIIFDRLGIDTMDVLGAAGTKWNFLPFRPGLVGGHCIGVDPYYLTHKAEMVGYHPEVILAAASTTAWASSSPSRRQVAGEERLAGEGRAGAGAGPTFKEDCPDPNSRVIDVDPRIRVTARTSWCTIPSRPPKRCTNTA
jgi:UDP-N-acetyl-D-galactosamine dehydrogenase